MEVEVDIATMELEPKNMEKEETPKVMRENSEGGERATNYKGNIQMIL
jgi:hypothetical protein